MKPSQFPAKPGDPKWMAAANSLARSFCPPIYACSKCRYPVVQGYRCTYCGDTNPSEEVP